MLELELLKQLGIDPNKLSAEKLEKLMHITDNVKDPKDITMEVTREIINILGMQTRKTEAVAHKQIEKEPPRNSRCNCQSGKKYKKCCGLPKNVSSTDT
jgi:uncharacterized protein YecA (UPF0149 family)